MADRNRQKERVVIPSMVLNRNEPQPKAPRQRLTSRNWSKQPPQNFWELYTLAGEFTIIAMFIYGVFWCVIGLFFLLMLIAAAAGA